MKYVYAYVWVYFVKIENEVKFTNIAEVLI